MSSVSLPTRNALECIRSLKSYTVHIQLAYPQRICTVCRAKLFCPNWTKENYTLTIRSIIIQSEILASCSVIIALSSIFVDLPLCLKCMNPPNKIAVFERSILSVAGRGLNLPGPRGSETPYSLVTAEHVLARC